MYASMHSRVLPCCQPCPFAWEIRDQRSLCTFGVRIFSAELSRDVSVHSFVFSERLIVLLLRQTFSCHFSVYFIHPYGTGTRTFPPQTGTRHRFRPRMWFDWIIHAFFQKASTSSYIFLYIDTMYFLNSAYMKNAACILYIAYTESIRN